MYKQFRWLQATYEADGLMYKQFRWLQATYEADGLMYKQFLWLQATYEADGKWCGYKQPMRLMESGRSNV